MFVVRKQTLLRKVFGLMSKKKKEGAKFVTQSRSKEREESM
jgi:hypothetical protein